MASYVSKSQIVGLIKEDTEGVLKDLTAGSQFMEVREGTAISGAVETIDSDVLVAGSIGASKSFVTREAPTGSFPKYLKHGTEGVAPEYSILVESAMGAVTVNSTEYAVTAGSSAGTATTRASLEMAGNNEDNFVKGQAVLIKDGVNNYSIRNVYNVDSVGNQLDLNFNLSAAPASGVALGKAIAFRPGNAHPTFSVHHWQALTGSAYKQAMAGCRTTSMEIQLPALGFAEISFEVEGINFYFNPIRISATNKYLDITDDSSTLAVVLTEKVYKTPIDLAREIAAKCTAASAAAAENNVISCAYSNTTGKFTLSSAGATFSLLWNTGTNAANSVGTTLGFAVAADDTGALTYTSDNAISFDTALTPAYDGSDNLIVKNNQLFIGGFADNICVQASTVSFSISTPKTNVPSICAESGITESVVLSREVTFSATVKLDKYESKYFDNLVRNAETAIMFNAGTKAAGNWEPGKCINIYLPQCSLTGAPIADQDGYQVFNLEAKAFVGSLEDVYINFL
jgi:hypothetical protein